MTRTLQLILASQSPRRKQLLTEHNFDFSVILPSESAEGPPKDGELPEQLVARLARQKAFDVAQLVDHGIVLGCDTVAECAGQILGKPRDRSHAREMLMLLRGREHQVLSGVCLWSRPDDQFRVGVDITRLRMDDVLATEIESYLDSGGWAGKAGAFGYQDSLDWIHIVEGSESNVVGLPMELLGKMLEEFAP